MFENKKTSLLSAIVFSGIGVIVGIILIILSTQDEWSNLIIHISFIVLGALAVLVNVPSLISGILRIDTTNGRFLTVSAVVAIALGVLLVFQHQEFTKYIVSFYMIAVPTITIIVSSERKSSRLKREIPKIIVGVVLLIIGFANMLSLLITVAGLAAILLSVGYLLFGVINFLLKGNSSQK